MEVTAKEAEWKVCPASLATSTPVAPPASSSSCTAGLPGQALRSCKGALSKLTGSLSSFAHSLPHHQQRRQKTAPQHPTLDLELTGAEAMWLTNADAADWALPVATATEPATAAATAAATDYGCC